MSDMKPEDITLDAVVADLRQGMKPAQEPMIAELEETLRRVRVQSAYAGKSDFEILGEVMGHTQMIPMYGDGVEEHLTRPLTQKFGITGLANLAFSPQGQEKQLLAYMICASRLVERRGDVIQTLTDQFGVADPEELEDLTEQIDHELRWTYNGDVKRFFEDLAKLPPDDKGLKERIYELNHQNTLARFNHTSTLPEPNMMG